MYVCILNFLFGIKKNKYKRVPFVYTKNAPANQQKKKYITHSETYQGVGMYKNNIKARGQPSPRNNGAPLHRALMNLNYEFRW